MYQEGLYDAFLFSAEFLSLHFHVLPVKESQTTKQTQTQMSGYFSA
jgi:hypothetical protein